MTILFNLELVLHSKVGDLVVSLTDDNGQKTNSGNYRS